MSKNSQSPVNTTGTYSFIKKGIAPKQQPTKHRRLTYTKNSHPRTMLHFTRTANKPVAAAKLNPKAMDNLHHIVLQLGTLPYLQANIALREIMNDSYKPGSSNINKYKRGFGLLRDMLNFFDDIEIIN
ncbi:MAG: hypothetical protein QM503_03870 [Bacteroidota bacterium]